MLLVSCLNFGFLNSSIQSDENATDDAVSRLAHLITSTSGRFAEAIIVSCREAHATSLNHSLLLGYLRVVINFLM